MQKLLLSLLFAAILGETTGQTLAKKYLLIEHFTNSRCSVCASRNPAFYTAIAQFPNDVHHVSIHPPIPYSNCVFYQANPTENDARKTFYGVDGTPTIFLNGIKNVASGALITTAKIQTYQNKTSPLYLKVVLTGTGDQRNAQIDAFSLAQIPGGNLRLFVMAVEKAVNYAAPNGETLHQDVMRDILTASTGDVFTPAAAGGKVSFNFNFTIPATWIASEIFVLAFVQNIDTEDVLNSGTNLDPVFTDAIEPIDNQKITLSPNPASDVLQVISENEKLESVEVFDAAGRVVLQQNFSENRANLDVEKFSPGVYFVKIRTAAGVFYGKLLKN